jgi:hypothetical protein
MVKDMSDLAGRRYRSRENVGVIGKICDASLQGLALSVEFLGQDTPGAIAACFLDVAPCLERPLQ